MKPAMTGQSKCHLDVTNTKFLPEGIQELLALDTLLLSCAKVKLFYSERELNCYKLCYNVQLFIFEFGRLWHYFHVSLCM